MRKAIEKNYKYICYYINSRGKIKQKLFETCEEGLEFCKVLDERIKKGTCGGYDFMKI